MSLPWLMHLTLIAAVLPTCNVFSYRRNYEAKYSRDDIPQWKQRACEKAQKYRANSHYICDDKGDVKCLPGWQGDLCQVPMCRKGCDPMNGYCQRPGECRCRIGYTGEFCEKCIPLPGCSHGYCTRPFECLCKPGWDGLFCTEPTCRQGCHSTRGYCDGPGECRCRIGWGGRNCSDCAVLPGCAHGTCSKPLECHCLPGYTGLLCQTPFCATDCDKQHGYCKKPGECRCKVGWTDPNCDKCFPYPGCLNGDCQKPWECNCKYGWGGMLCDEKLSYCVENPNICENNGECLSLTKDDGNYRCHCKQGYFGKNCENVDEFMLTSTVAPRITPPPQPVRWNEEELQEDVDDDDADEEEEEEEEDGENAEDDASVEKQNTNATDIHVELPTLLPMTTTTPATVGNIDNKMPTNATHLNTTITTTMPTTIADNFSLPAAPNEANNAVDVNTDVKRQTGPMLIFPIGTTNTTRALAKTTTKLTAINDTLSGHFVGAFENEINLTKREHLEESTVSFVGIVGTASTKTTTTSTKKRKPTTTTATEPATTATKPTTTAATTATATPTVATSTTTTPVPDKNGVAMLNEQKPLAVIAGNAGAETKRPLDEKATEDDGDDYEEDEDEDDNVDEDDDDDEDDDEDEEDVASFIPNLFDNET